MPLNWQISTAKTCCVQWKLVMLPNFWYLLLHDFQEPFILIIFLWVFFRSSQIAYTVTTAHVMCMQMALHAKICARYWFLCVKIIWIWQCVYLFFCLVLGCLLSFIVLSYSLPVCCTYFFCLFVFMEANFAARP